MVNEFNAHEESVINNDEFNDPCELKSRIIHRHLLIKTFEEINQQFKKYKRQFDIDFDEES